MAFNQKLISSYVMSQPASNNHNNNKQNVSNGISVRSSKSTKESCPMLTFARDYDRYPKKVSRPQTLTKYLNNPCLSFQLIDTDYYVGFHPLRDEKQKTCDKSVVVRLYGATIAGESVLCHCLGFQPYFYCDAPVEFIKNRDECVMRDQLNKIMAQRNLNKTRYNECNECITKIVSLSKQSLWGYHFGERRLVLKIYTAWPWLNKHARKIIIEHFKVETYESDIDFNLRFMIDRNIVGGGWVELKASKYRIVPIIKQSSFCSMEIVSDFQFVHGLSNVDHIAPLRILSFDIECMTSGGFPEPQNDAIIQISNVCYIQGSEHKINKESDSMHGDFNVESMDIDSVVDNENDVVDSNLKASGEIFYHKNVFCLKSCSPITDCNVYSYETESELLNDWAKFLRKIDPDIVTGYNIINFDLPFLIDRAEYLEISGFSCLGRLKYVKSKIKENFFQNQTNSFFRLKRINIPGRFQMDLLPYLRGHPNYKLRSYSLNSVSYHFLKLQKEDVKYSEIGKLQNGNQETRRRLAQYCLKDSILPLKLIQNLQVTVNLIEMARVTGVPISFLIFRGEQIKVLSQLYRAAKKENLIIPFRPKNVEINIIEDNGVGYEGATVIEPIKGYYKEPIITLDFASLYPSIMIAHNLCYSTMIDERDVSRLDKEMYTKTPLNTYFISKSVQRGILPEILKALISERGKIKAMMKELVDNGKEETMLYIIYDARQLALKVSANSVYGFTGTGKGSLSCLDISGAVTAYGRDMIASCKTFIEDTQKSRVIYGDTDSVMIKLNQSDGFTIKQMIEAGEEIAKITTETLFGSLPPISLKFEKVYKPYLLICKKKYVGMKWTEKSYARSRNLSDMDCKGIEIVRRDNCPLTKQVMQRILKYIMIDGDEKKAIQYTKNMISKLLRDKIDLSLLIITKTLNQIDGYKTKQRHVQLVKRMRDRNDSKRYEIGDRVGYVIIRVRDGVPPYEKAEDPLYVLLNGLVIDTDYYLEKQLKGPLERIFKPILHSSKSALNQLFYGIHTRSIQVPVNNFGPMMSFVVKQKTCIGCKCIVQSKDTKSICFDCEPSQLYMRQMNVVRRKQREFHNLWTHCQDCQGSHLQEVLCGNRDCPIFFKRIAVRKELDDALSLLDKF